MGTPKRNSSHQPLRNSSHQPSITCGCDPSSIVTACPSFPTTVTLTIQTSSWGWNAGTNCTPSVATVVLTKNTTVCGVFSGFFATGVCIGGKLCDVSLTYGTILLRTGWKLTVQPTVGTNASTVYIRPSLTDICNLFGDYPFYTFGTFSTAPTSYPSTVNIS